MLIIFFLCCCFSISIPEGVFVATTSSIVSFVEQFNKFFKCPSKDGKCRGKLCYLSVFIIFIVAAAGMQAVHCMQIIVYCFVDAMKFTTLVATAMTEVQTNKQRFLLGFLKVILQCIAHFTAPVHIF